MQPVQRKRLLALKKKYFEYNKGLFHGEKPMIKVRVSEMGNKSKRPLFPNVQNVPLYSELLDRRIVFLTTTNVLNIIDKKGGLDNYLLKTPSKELHSEVALKWRAFLLAFREAKLKLLLNDTALLNSLGIGNLNGNYNEDIDVVKAPCLPLSSSLFPATVSLNNKVLRQFALYKAITPHGFVQIPHMKQNRPFSFYLKKYLDVPDFVKQPTAACTE